MNKIFGIALLTLAPILPAAEPPKISPLPIPLSNNAVTMMHSGKEAEIFSFMGIGPKKTWNAITNQAFKLDLNNGKWQEVRPVPGPAGRVAAGAVAVRGQVVLLGGYTVDGYGGETTVSDMNVYIPPLNLWYRGDDIPVPVDDFVLGVYRDRYVYVVGGWSKTDSVRNVQIYDAEKRRWMEGTPIPGTAVFGHSGALVGDTIVYVDGAYKNPNGSNPKYVAANESWMGKINKAEVTKIEWTKMPEHPGTARYRIAAVAAEKDNRIYFSGGTDNPYDYNGIGYNGQPSEPSPLTFAFNLRSGKWETINENTPDATMDHRGMAVTHLGLLIVGGMAKGQEVTPKVTIVKTTPAK